MSKSPGPRGWDFSFTHDEPHKYRMLSFSRFLSESSFAQMSKVYIDRHVGDEYETPGIRVAAGRLAASPGYIKDTLKKLDAIRKQYPRLGREVDISYWLARPFQELRNFIEEHESEIANEEPKASVIFQNEHVVISKAENFSGAHALGKQLIKGRRKTLPWCICVDAQTWESYAEGIDDEPPKTFTFVDPVDTSEESFILEFGGRHGPLAWGLDNDFTFPDTYIPTDRFGMSNKELREFGILPPLRPAGG